MRPVPCAAVVVAASLVGASLALPPTAAAQSGREAFASALIEVHDALEALYGDEGAHLPRLLDTMADALRNWDQDLSAAATDTSAAGDRQDALTALGTAYLERGRVDQALEVLARAMTASPDDPTPHLLRGLVRIQSEPSEAMRDLHAARARAPQDPVIAYWVVEIGATLGIDVPPQDALDTLMAAYRQAVLGRALRNGTPFFEPALFRDGAADTPIFPLARYHAGFAHAVGRTYDEAIASLQRAIADDPLVSDPALQSEPVQLAAAELRQGRGAAAVEHLRRAVAVAPHSSEVHRLLGVALRAAGMVEESVASLEQAIAIDAENERAHLELVSVLSSAGLRTRMQRALEGAIEAVPSSGSARWDLASLHWLSGHDAEALRHLEAIPVASLLVGKAQVHGAIGRVHLGGRVDHLRQAARADPNDAASHVHLGEFYRMEGLEGEALASYVAAVLIAPNHAEPHAAIGQIHLAAGRLDEATVAFRRALDLQPGHLDVRYGLAQVLLQRGERFEAQLHLDRFQELQRAHEARRRRQYEVGLLERAASVAEDAGRHEDAAAARQAIVDHEPESAAHHAALGEALVRAGHAERAIAHLERAIVLGAPRGVFRTLAEALAAAGREEQSAAALAQYRRRQVDEFRHRARITGAPPETN